MPRPTNRRCYATGCKQLVPPAMLICRRHWYMVPKAIRDRVWATYQQGQELPNGPAPTTAYWSAIRAAREAVAATDRQESSLFNEEG